MISQKNLIFSNVSSRSMLRRTNRAKVATSYWRDIRTQVNQHVSARGVWRTIDKTFLDERIFHGNKSNSGPIDKAFCLMKQKKRVYNRRIIIVEKKISNTHLY